MIELRQVDKIYNTATGSFLVALGSSSVYAVSLAIIALVGVMSATFDAMQWTLLQESVPENTRGRAIGGWAFATGFGWIGILGLGALGAAFGVRWTIATAGALVIVTGALMWSRVTRVPSTASVQAPAR